MSNARELAELGGSYGTGGFVGMKNRIINGAMMIDQRNAGASVTNSSSSSYTLDRWNLFASQASKFTIQQNAGSVTPPAGFKNYLGITSSSAYSVGASELFIVGQAIEGFNTADFGFGAAGASTITFSFWVRSSLTGSFGGSLLNSAQNRSYPFTYTISAANTWEQKVITVAGDTTGTWIGATNGVGLFVYLNLGTGTTYSGTAGAWAGATYFSATGATSVVGTSGATFYITGVQLEKGSTATSFDYRPYGTELALCQRYYETGSVWAVSYNNSGTQIQRAICPFQVVKRASPTNTISVAAGSLTSVSFADTRTNAGWVAYASASGGLEGLFTYTSSAEL